MRIERVDDTTVKLFITYSDIEARDLERRFMDNQKRRRILLVNDG